MKRGLWALLVLALVAGAGFWAYRFLFPAPESVVRKQLRGLAEAASIAPNESPAARLLNAQRVGDFFARDAEVVVDIPPRLVRTFSSRQEIVETATAARSVLTSLRIEFVDASVAVGPDRQTAEAHLTLKANFPGEALPEVQELKLSFQRDGGDWLVQRVQTVKTLR